MPEAENRPDREQKNAKCRRALKNIGFRHFLHFGPFSAEIAPNFPRSPMEIKGGKCYNL
jgi:hypothetical protein